MIYVVGIGPGKKDQMTQRALDVLEKCDVIVGYKRYIELIAPHFEGRKELIASPMKGEVKRCQEALKLSKSGKTVGLVSSGDAGVYGMAGIMLEIADTSTEVEIVPGITAASSAAALLGAPLMHDFAIISLSDLLTPWDLIEKRLEAAASADFVICLYNPASKGRPNNLKMASEILSRIISEDTITGWVRNAGRDNESYGITTLKDIAKESIDMFCTIIVGNSSTKFINDRMVTPRGYKV